LNEKINPISGVNKPPNTTTKSTRKNTKRRLARQRSLNGPSNKNAIVTLTRSPVGSGFPEELDVTLSYNFFSGITVPASTLAGAYAFRLNDTYDPDYTGGGHQPMYRDQLFALYSNCCVWKTEARTIISSTTTTPLYAVALVTRATATASDISETAERGEATPTKLITLAKSQTFSVSADVAERFGITRSQLLADDLNSQGNAATPSNVLYYSFSIVDPTGTGTTAYANTQLLMHVRFRRLLEVGRS
jgi:hypothetical protein